MNRDHPSAPERFAAVRPKPVRLSPSELVRTSSLEAAIPVLLEPVVDGVDLRAWAGANRDYLDNLLLAKGAVLFRKFRVPSLDKFERIARTLCREVIEYGEQSSPRTRLTGRIYSSTDHPRDQSIRLHNEQSYTLNWPMKIFFHCVRVAGSGGRTPIADCRRIYSRLDLALAERFLQRQILYVRNYGDGLGLAWQVAFGTDERTVVETHCREAGIAFEWRDGDRLRTRQVRPAIRRHPDTDETLWFNHAAFFHFSSLAPEAQANISAVLSREDVPFETFYGDGAPIEGSVLDAIREAYDAETMRFDWKAGDILMLDNMLVCHGREPFTGSREVTVAMGDPVGALLK